MGVVAKRSSMTFYSDPNCHYSHRVRIVLAEKGVTVDVEDVTTDTLPEDVIELNPYQSLPTLVDRELTIYETKVMMEYLDERFPHPPLLPVYPVARALIRQFMHRIERDYCVQIDALVKEPNGKAADAARKDLAESFSSIAPIFAEKPYFMSDEFTLVDCCLSPILWRFNSLDIKLANTRQVKPLKDYMARLFERPAFQESLSEIERDM